MIFFDLMSSEMYRVMDSSLSGFKIPLKDRWLIYLEENTIFLGDLYPRFYFFYHRVFLIMNFGEYFFCKMWAKPIPIFDDFYCHVKVGFFSKSSWEKFTDPIRVRLISNFGVQNVYNTITKRTEVVSLLNFPDFVFLVAQVKIVVCPLWTNCIDLKVNFWVGKKNIFFQM